MILCCDTEVFKHHWLFLAYDMLTGQKTVIENDPAEMRRFYESHKNWIWAAYNASYDSAIIKAILLDLDPFDMSQFLIERDGTAYQFDKRTYDIQLYTYDAMFDKTKSLKKLEAFMGESIVETEVDFSLDRELTEDEKASTRYYCENDVLMLAKVMSLTTNHFFAKWGLIKRFDLPISYISRTVGQIVAEALGGERTERYDEWDLKFPDYECKIEKYKDVVQWYFQPENQWIRRMRPKKTNPKEMTEEKNEGLQFEIAGCKGSLGWGGLHGSRDGYIASGNIVDLDILSAYPTQMMKWGLISRSSKKPKVLDEIFVEQARLKAIGDKFNRAPLKVAINTIYGLSSADSSTLCDKRQAHMVCLSGQIMLIDLIEQLEPYTILFNLNTDGVFFTYDGTPETWDKIMKVAADWERRTRMTLESDKFVRMVQSNVNNYIACPSDLFDKKGNPNWKPKGGMSKMGSILDNNLSIVAKALNYFFVFGKEPVETIYESDDLIDFQNVYGRTSEFKFCYYNPKFTTREETTTDSKGNPKTKLVKEICDDGELLTDKTYRVFAVTDERGSLYKSKKYRIGASKFTGAPDNLVVWNDSVKGLKCDAIPTLDRDWYVRETWRRILLYYFTSEVIKSGFFDRVSEEKLTEMKNEVREKVKESINASTKI